MTGMAARVRSGSIWIAASRGLIAALGLISTFVLARLLVPADFGLVAIGTTILAIALAITDLSLVQALIHHEDPTEQHLHSAWTLNFLRGLAIAVLLAIAAPFIATFFEDNRLIGVILVIAFSMLMRGLENARVAMLQKDMQFWQDFVISVAQKLALVVFSVGFALVYRSYLALLIGIGASSAIRVVISYCFVPFMPRFRLKEAKELFSFSGWLALGQVISTLNWRIEPLLIGKFLPVHQLGLFTVSLNVAQLPTRELTLPLTKTLFPAFRQLRDNPARMRAAYMRVQPMVFAAAMFAGPLLALVADPAVRLTLGPNWLEAIPVLQVLAVALTLQTFGNSAQPIAMATGNTKLIFRRNMQAFVYRLPLIFLGLYLDGLRGFLIARVLVGLMSTGLDCLLVKEVVQIGYREQLKANMRTFAACFVMVGIVFGCAQFFSFDTGIVGLLASIAVSGTVAFTIYIAALFSLWALSGRPLGAENELLNLLVSLKRRVLRS